MATPVMAANAYAQLARLGDQSTGSLAKTIGGAADGDGGPSFTDVLKSAIQSVEETSRKSDAQSGLMAAGKADLVDVATAIAETETAVQAMVSVRDKVVAAYQQILQMPI
jgi:flagellar hook-basal body complex protein FliE